MTLLRRLSFDLLGLPPTSEELDVYLADKSPEERAYEKQVDRLLRSPHYGERMAMFWLDLVRFADTRGYHSDNPRNVTPYRDYVIRSFNDNLAFDQFTIEQLAGDLLPEPDVWQRVATCYNKLNQTTEEGGAQAQEYEAMNASDRVRNVSVVWMGATLGCAQCHEHKFDPYPAEDFYQLAAFFADIKEAAIMDRDKGIPVPSPEHEAALQDLAEKITAVKSGLENLPPALAAELEKAQAKWEGDVARRVVPELGPWYALGPFLADNARRAFETSYPPEEKIDLEASYQKGKLKWQERAEWKDGAVHNLTGTNAATYLYRSVDVDSDSSLGISLGSDDGIRLWINGQEVLSKDVQRGVAPDQEKVTVSLRAGKNQLLMKITNAGGGYGFYFKALGTDGVPAAIRAVLKIPAAERSDPARHRDGLQ